MKEKVIAIVSTINDDDNKIIDSHNNYYSAEQIGTSTELKIRISKSAY